MKLSVNETKLTGLCARNCATIQQVLILKEGPEKLPGLSRNEPLAGYILEGLDPLTKVCERLERLLRMVGEVCSAEQWLAGSETVWYMIYCVSCKWRAQE